MARAWQELCKSTVRAWQDHGKSMARAWQDHGKNMANAGQEGLFLNSCGPSRSMSTSSKNKLSLESSFRRAKARKGKLCLRFFSIRKECALLSTLHSHLAQEVPPNILTLRVVIIRVAHLYCIRLPHPITAYYNYITANQPKPKEEKRREEQAPIVVHQKQNKTNQWPTMVCQQP